MRSKNCKHEDKFGRCNQPAIFKIDESETYWVDWSTGRKQWNEPEITQMPMHPLKRTSMCFHHTKQAEGLYDTKELYEKAREKRLS